MGHPDKVADQISDGILDDIIKEIGYTHPDIGFDYTCGVLSAIHSQSPDIARGVDHAEGKASEQEMGAGDQGLMFGYATVETDVLMPLPIHLAHRIVERLAELRQNRTL